MKKLLMAMVLMPAIVFADTATIGGIKWTYWASDTGATIESAWVLSEQVPSSIVIPSELGGVPVTAIGRYGEGCIFDDLLAETMSSVIIPESVIIIDDNAFEGCCSLKAVEIPGDVVSIGNMSFAGCDNLGGIVIPEGVTSIGDDAFGWCSSLASVLLPQSLTHVGWGAFECCPLTEIVIPSGVAEIADCAFRDCYLLASASMSDSVTCIGEGAFADCISLTEVTIPRSVKRIGDDAFAGCSALVSVTISSDGITIGDGAFGGCKGLANSDGFVIVGDVVYGYYGNDMSVAVPFGVKGVSSEAFRDCSNLVFVTLPTSVTGIGYRAFSGCRGLASITIPEGVLRIGNQAFQDCQALISVSLPKSLTSIGTDVFKNTKLVNEDDSDFVVVEGCAVAYKGYNRQVTIPQGVRLMADNLFFRNDLVESIVIPEGVSCISSSAFYMCVRLMSISIPSTVKKISNNAFYGCQLREVHIGDLKAWCNIEFVWDDRYFSFSSQPLQSGELFLNGEKVVDLVVPSGVEAISPFAFFGCSSIKSVKIPASVKCIGEGAFEYCRNLERVTIPSTVKSIGAAAFSGCERLSSDLVIPAGVEEIGSGAFEYCRNLERVTIPSTVKSIGAAAFSGCERLSSDLVIPAGVRAIGQSAFANCSSLPHITLQNGVELIGGRAFFRCTNLDSVAIPASVTGIGTAAFAGCEKCAAIFVDANNSNYSSQDGVLYDKKKRNVLCCPAGRNGVVTIASGVTNICQDAFVACKSLMSVEIPNSVQTIGGSAFNGCGIAEISIPEGVTSIGSYAFASCGNLASVVIPSTVTYIGVWAFGDCAQLSSVEILSDDALVDWYVFSGCQNISSIKVSGRVPLSQLFQDGYSNIREVALLDGVRVLDETVFAGCRSLETVHIPSTVERITSMAFRDTRVGSDSPDGPMIVDGCLIGYKGNVPSSVTIPNGVRLIADAVFYGCTGLTSITLPDGLTNLGDAAFRNCPGLADSDGWVIVGNVLYGYYGSLSELTIPTGVQVISSWVFADNTKIEKVMIPSGVKSIGDAAFRHCRGLSAAVLPEGLTQIGEAAFCRCESLQTINIPTGVKVINAWAFAHCAFASIVLPRSVTEIRTHSEYGDYYGAFEDCADLREITVSSNLTRVDIYSFSGCDRLKVIHVDSGDGLRAKELFRGSGVDVETIEFKEQVVQRCLVMFDACGGTADLENKEVTKGSSVGVLPLATRIGYSFEGWYTAANSGSQVTAATVVMKDVTFYAHWRKEGDEPVDPPSTDPAVVCEVAAEYRTKADIGVIPVEVVNVGEAVKIAVKGLPSGVKFTAKDVADKKTKKVTVPANSIYGTPTKSGVYAATVTVTPADRKSKMTPIVRGLLFVVRNADEHVVVADCDAAQGSVKGMGVYASGKKVTLKATAAKGWVFSGWYGEGLGSLEGLGGLVSQAASWSFTMPEVDVNLTARFVTAAEDKESIGVTVDGFAFGSAAESGGSTVSRDVVVKQGMPVEWPVAASALSATTVKVSGLPSGLKFTAKDIMKKGSKTEVEIPANTIYGTPKTASKVDKNGNVTPSKVKITVTTAGKAKQEYVLNVTVRGIPAEGTFNGGSASGLVTLTVAKTGKISGKYLADGKTWTLSAAGFDTWDDDDRLTATLTAKSGKEVQTVALVYADGYVCASLTSGQETASPLFEAWRNEWKTEPQKSLAAKLKGQKVTVGEDDNIVLTVGSNGAVTAKGTFGSYSASCSTVLIPTESKGTYMVYLYFPPKAGKFDGWVGTAYITAE